MSVVDNQGRTLAGLLARLRPHWHRDPGLPGRIEDLLRRDRRLYRDLVYTAVRHLPWIEPWLDRDPGRAVRAIAWLAADTPATRAFRAALLGSAAPDPSLPPASVADKAAALAGILGAAPAASLLPSWFERECPEAFRPPNYDVLNTRAPLWLRLSPGDPDPVFAEFAARAWPWRRSPLLSSAVEILGEVDVTATAAFRAGAFEIQDVGSQLILESAGLTPGEHWLDACAGAGGKSLQLATLLGPGGRVDACDVRPAALAELARRAERAGLARRITRPNRPAASYDGVLVDAPCSGTGTWRRSPHLKWVTTPARVQTAAARQQALLAQFATRVRPGGRLLYATCSLCPSENERVVERFLAAFPAFSAEPFAHQSRGEPRGAGLVFWPATHNGDGYFVANLRKA